MHVCICSLQLPVHASCCAWLSLTSWHWHHAASPCPCSAMHGLLVPLLSSFCCSIHIPCPMQGVRALWPCLWGPTPRWSWTLHGGPPTLQTLMTSSSQQVGAVHTRYTNPVSSSCAGHIRSAVSAARQARRCSELGAAAAADHGPPTIMQGASSAEARALAHALR